MTEELKKQGGVDDAAAVGLVEETAAASTELDDAAKAAAEREARRQALYLSLIHIYWQISFASAGKASCSA